jgi:hypothetical protein
MSITIFYSKVPEKWWQYSKSDCSLHDQALQKASGSIGMRTDSM